MATMARAIAGIMALSIVACTSRATPDVVEDTIAPLRIFWNQGFYPEEDLALKTIVNAWKAETGIPVELAFYSSDDILNQTNVALENGTPPDVVFAHRVDLTLQPLWAWEGKLVDVSDVIEPYRNDYSPAALEAAYLENRAAGTRSYYGVPIEQQTIHIHYWRSLLKEAGLDEAQIPQEWDAFWEFWRQAQVGLHKAGKSDVYGLGLTLSIQGTDTYYLFEQVMDAYDIALFSETGQFRGNDPDVRAALIKVLNWTTQFYQGDYVPKDAVKWLDSDNNIKFLNQAVLMTPNPSLSIPASQRQDATLYNQQIATQPFPNEPDGDPMTYLVSVKQALIFTESQNPEAAKAFLSYLLKPERLNEYVKGSLGRWFPVMDSALADPFWQESTDPHVSVAVQQFTQSPTQPFYQALNPAYSRVHTENVWGQALGRVVVDGWSVEDAVDAAIATIQEMMSDWDDPQ